MAGTFDIQHTTATVSGRGPSVTGQVSFDTGAERQAQAIGALGGAALQTGATMWQVEAATQFSEHRLNTTRAANKLLADMELTRDSQARAELVTEFQDAAADVEISNGLAARKYQEWLNLSMPDIEKAVAAKNRKIAVDDFTAQAFELGAEAERSGNLSAVRTHLGVGVVTGLISKTESAGLLAQVQNRADYNMSRNETLVDPQGFLNSLTTKNGKRQVPGRDLTPTQIGTLIGHADAQIARNKRQQDVASSALVEDVNRLAAEGKTAHEVESLIKQTVGISNQEKAVLMKAFLAAEQIWGGGVKNPFEETRRPELVAVLDLAITAGKPISKALALELGITPGEPISERDIGRVQILEPEKGPTFNRSTYLSLVSRIKAKEDDILKATAVKELEKHIWDLYEKDDIIPTEDAGDYNKDIDDFRNIIMKHNGDISKAQHEINGILKPRKAGLVRRWIRLTFPIISKGLEVVGR